MSNGSTTWRYTYDANSPITVTRNGTTYYAVNSKDIVTGILDSPRNCTALSTFNAKPAPNFGAGDVFLFVNHIIFAHK